MKKKIFSYMLIAVVLVIAGFFAIPPNKDSLYPKFTSFQIFDRNGRLLREVLSKDYKTSVWVSLNKMSPDMIKATILREDKRFFLHYGVDLYALIRAFYENIRNRKIISGGSTITMQVAKMALNLKKRNILTKILEVIYALKLELHLNKPEILEIYFNRTPYGNQTYGVEAASNFYFRKSAEQLSLGESCILSAIPTSPTRLNPYINSDLVLEQKKNLLKLLLEQNIVDSLRFFCAMKESLNIVTKNINFEAPHFIDFLLNEFDKYKVPNCSKITSTIDLNLQENLEKLTFTSIKSLRSYNVNQGAVLVMNSETGEILVMVGSKDYFDTKEGQVNGCLALRQPGSSIKPLLYILGLTYGIPVSVVLPDSVLEFRLPDGTLFAPRNYGNKYHGPTRAREALGSSFNVPTVYLLQKIGVQQFYNFLKDLNFHNLKQKTSFYGLSLALGAAEANLLEMVQAYRAIANGGIWTGERTILTSLSSPLTSLSENSHRHCEPSPIRMGEAWQSHYFSNSKRVFSKESAYIITDILSDNASRLKAFGEDSPLNLPFPCACKTGTSKNFRDNWCIGFTKKYVVGVWVGNFDGSPMAGISGISGAAPLFRDIMIELHKNEYPQEFEEPPSLIHLKICGKTGKVASNNCQNLIEEIFIPGTEPRDTCNFAHESIHQSLMDNTKKDFQIINPKQEDIYKIDPQVSYKVQSITFKVHSEQAKIEHVTFKLNNKILCTKSYPFEYYWHPKPGEYKLEAIGKGKSTTKIDQVVFKVF